MAPLPRIGSGTFGGNRFLPPPSFGPSDSIQRTPMPSMPAMPDTWRYAGHALQILPYILRRSLDPNGELTRRPIGPVPDLPREQPPPGPVGGLLGLIAQYAQQRRAASDEDGNPTPASPDQKRATLGAGEREQLDQPDPDIRRLERIDTTAVKRRRSVRYSPPLVPNMPLDDDPDLGMSAADWSDWGPQTPECDEERSKAYKACVAGRRVNRLFGGKTLDDCIKAAISSKCGGTKIDWGPTVEERARALTERVRRIMNGEDPDNPNN